MSQQENDGSPRLIRQPHFMLQQVFAGRVMEMHNAFAIGRQFDNKTSAAIANIHTLLHNPRSSFTDREGAVEALVRQEYVPANVARVLRHAATIVFDLERILADGDGESMKYDLWKKIVPSAKTLIPEDGIDEAMEIQAKAVHFVTQVLDPHLPERIGIEAAKKRLRGQEEAIGHTYESPSTQEILDMMSILAHVNLRNHLLFPTRIPGVFIIYEEDNAAAYRPKWVFVPRHDVDVFAKVVQSVPEGPVVR